MSQEEEESNDREENSNNIVEFDLEYVQQDQGNSDSADENIEEEDNSNESEKDSEDKSGTVWFCKLQQLIDHV
eukprot:4901989-Ditylum_brightwellii.AAC.1